MGITDSEVIGAFKESQHRVISNALIREECSNFREGSEAFNMLLLILFSSYTPKITINILEKHDYLFSTRNNVVLNLLYIFY
jgi:two-component sensor histidine kinase